jgi:hypothetical protein
MEKRLNGKIDEYIQAFKNDIHSKILAADLQDRNQISELIQHVFEYPENNALDVAKKNVIIVALIPKAHPTELFKETP